MLRTYHRWAAVTIGLFLILIAATGVALQVDLLVSGKAPPGEERKERTAPVRPLPDRKEMNRMTDVLFASLSGRRDVSAERIEFTFAAPRPFATVGPANPFGEAVRVDLASGAITPAPPLDAGLHGFLQDIHAGYFIGLPGRIISVLSGLGLLVLSVTGLKVYLDLYLRRRNSKRRNPFWR